MFYRQAGVALCVLCVALAGDLARAAEKVALRTNLPAGTNWAFVSNEQMNLQTTMKAAGQQQQMQQKALRKISGRTEVLEANAGVPTVLRVTFDRDCGGEMDMGQMGKQPMPFALAGRTVTIKIGPNGAITHDAGQLAPPDQQELQSIAEADDAYLPREAVGIGDTWSPDMAAVARKWQVDPNKSKMGLALTLKDFQDIGGRRAAIVEFNGEVMGDMEGLSGSRQMRGTAMIDVQTGRVVNVDMTGNARMSGMQQQQGQDGNAYVIEIQSEGTMASRAEVKFGGAGMGGAAPGGFAPIGNPGGGVAPGGMGSGGGIGGTAQQPDGPGGMMGGNAGGNPPAGTPPAGTNAPGGFGNGVPTSAPPEGTFTFKDETITLTFTRDPRLPGTSGMIVMGDKQFPAKISAWDGSNLAGTFEAEGASFDFTGRLNGDTMAFKTGDTTYNLKSAAPAKRNPLAK